MYTLAYNISNKMTETKCFKQAKTFNVEEHPNCSTDKNSLATDSLRIDENMNALMYIEQLQ